MALLFGTFLFSISELGEHAHIFNTQKTFVNIHNAIMIFWRDPRTAKQMKCMHAWILDGQLDLFVTSYASDVSYFRIPSLQHCSFLLFCCCWCISPFLTSISFRNPFPILLPLFSFVVHCYETYTKYGPCTNQ